MGKTEEERNSKTKEAECAAHNLEEVQMHMQGGSDSLSSSR